MVQWIGHLERMERVVDVRLRLRSDAFCSLRSFQRPEVVTSAFNRHLCPWLRALFHGNGELLDWCTVQPSLYVGLWSALNFLSLRVLWSMLSKI